MNKTDTIITLLQLDNPEYIQNLKNINNHLLLCDFERFNKFLDFIILESKKDNNLLTLKGYYTLLRKNFERDFIDYLKTLHATQILHYKEPERDKPLNDNVRCSSCAKIFFSTSKIYKYICDECKDKHLGGKYKKNG